MDDRLRETLRLRYEARVAEQERRREEEARAVLRQEEEARAVLRREAEEQSAMLVPLVQLQGELQDVIELVQTARNPSQVIPGLRQVAVNIQDYYQSDLLGSEELVEQIQATVAELVTAFNDNEGLVLQVGSYEYRTIQELIQTITSTTGVEIEIVAPIMDTSRDEEIARQLAEPQPAPNRYDGPSSVAPVRVERGAVELEEYSRVYTQLRSMRSATQSQALAVLRSIRTPTGEVAERLRGQLRTLLQNIVTYVGNRWGETYQLNERLQELEQIVESLQ